MYKFDFTYDNSLGQFYQAPAFLKKLVGKYLTELQLLLTHLQHKFVSILRENTGTPIFHCSLNVFCLQPSDQRALRLSFAQPYFFYLLWILFMRTASEPAF